MLEAKHHGNRSIAAPVWLISPDSRFSMETAECLKKTHAFCLKGAYTKWQSAVPVLRIYDSKSPKIVLVDEEPKTRDGSSCLSFLKNSGSGFSVIVFMNDMCDENLVSALSHGVSGFVLKPTSSDEIITAMEAVVRGEVWMKRSILERIASLVPYVMLKKSPSLTSREKEIVSLAVEGYSTKGIADKLNISYFTVDTHIKNIYQKLKVNNRSSLVSLVLHNRGL